MSLGTGDSPLPKAHGGSPPRVSLPALPRAEPYLELGSFSFMFQSFLWMHKAKRSGVYAKPAGLCTPTPSSLHSLPPHGRSWRSSHSMAG